MKTQRNPSDIVSIIVIGVSGVFHPIQAIILGEDAKVAKLLIGSIIGAEVLELALRPKKDKVQLTC